MNQWMLRRSPWVALAIAGVLAACSSSPAPGEGKKEGGAAPASAPAPAGGAGSAAAPGLDKAKLAELIKRHFASTGLPADVDLVVTEIKPSQIPGLQEGTIKLSRGEQSQDAEFLLSADSRWFLQGSPVDLTLDPVQSVLGKIDVGADHPSLGPKDAKVTIVEYSDFQCPFCARADTIVKEEVLKAYGDKVRFVYKQFPLASIHPWAEPASVIGLCVFKQAGNDAYWKYHAAVFSKQKEISGDGAEAQLMKIAKDAGADEAKVKACVDAEETQPIVDATLEEAEAIGVNSTPTFFVNGQRLSGAQPLDAFKGLIEPALKGAGKS